MKKKRNLSKRNGSKTTPSVLLVLFRKNLIRLRTREGLTQPQVAKRAALSTSYICMLEANGVETRSPTLATVERIADAFGKHPREFFRE